MYLQIIYKIRPNEFPVSQHKSSEIHELFFDCYVELASSSSVSLLLT